MAKIITIELTVKEIYALRDLLEGTDFMAGLRFSEPSDIAACKRIAAKVEGALPPVKA